MSLNKILISLHWLVYLLHVNVVLAMALYVCFKYQIDTWSFCVTGQLAADVARSEPMKQLLHVKPRTEVFKVPQRFEGLLIKVSHL